MDVLQGSLFSGQLGEVAKTLLIPLAARALAPTLNPDLNYRDAIAEELFRRLDVTPERFADDRASQNVTGCVADLNDAHWLQNLPWCEGRPALFLAEGVLMYLTQDGVESLIRGVAATADGYEAPVELAFDYASPWMVRNSHRHPSVKKTQARFQWALARPEDLRSIDPRPTLVGQENVTVKSGAIPALMNRVHRLFTGRDIYACVHYRR